MTDLLYHTDAYLREFDATVLAVDAEARAILLDRTAFYPGGGGQPADGGTLTIAGITTRSYARAKARRASGTPWAERSPYPPPEARFTAPWIGSGATT